MRTISATPPCWEYRAIYLDRLGAVEAFDELGDQGWELVSVIAEYAYFKRPTGVRYHRPHHR